MEEERDEISKKKPKRFYSPSSKLLMTPIRAAFCSSNKQPKDFIKKVQELIDSKKIQRLFDLEKNKENTKE